jgi:cytidyltransferase-like protein
MRYCFDIDGTICDTPVTDKGKNDYDNSTPKRFMVETVNRLYDEGHYIILMTARGRGSGMDWSLKTKQQLKKWGVKFHELEPMFHKPNADLFIDDKGVNVEDWRKTLPVTKGIVAGAFDILHPGYIRMFKYAKNYCNHLTVALHENPNTERDWKLKPVQSVEDRKEILLSLKDVDEVVTYDQEDQYLAMLDSGEYHMRFLGDDYSDGSYTGVGIGLPIVWIPRSEHPYSTTRVKTLIYQSYKK